jgi:dTDP-4-amino-4,6-dideoxygalactose transaminase
MVDLKGQYETLKPEIDSAVLQALAETRYILGPNVQAFDQEAAQYLGVNHAISCASGTDALHLALLAAGIRAGDEIITSAFTFIATAEAIRYIGAIPVFVDIEARSFNIDTQIIRAAITPRTRAILPVHLFGQPADMDEIMALADEFELLVIEDCAQSFGSRYRGKMTGGIGSVGAFSFFPSKNLGCYGDGGMITTDDDDIAAQIKMLRNLSRTTAIMFFTSTRCSATSATRCAKRCLRATSPARFTTLFHCTVKRLLPIPRNRNYRLPRPARNDACRFRFSRR